MSKSRSGLKADGQRHDNAPYAATYHANNSSFDRMTSKPEGAGIGLSAGGVSCSAAQVSRSDKYEERETKAEGIRMSLVSSTLALRQRGSLLQACMALTGTPRRQEPARSANTSF